MALQTTKQRAAATKRREIERPQQGRNSNNPTVGYGSGYIVQEKASIVGPPGVLPSGSVQSARGGR